MNEINSYVEASKKPRQGPTAGIQYALETTADGPVAQITANAGVIKCVMASSEELFPGGTFAMHPETPSGSITVPLLSEKNLEADVAFKVLVATSASSKTYQIEEFNLSLPKFSMFAQADLAQQPSGSVKFNISADPNQVHAWVSQNFTLKQPTPGEYAF